VPDVLAAGIEVVEPENLDSVAAKTVAKVGPRNPAAPATRAIISFP
jgi:hypothetical protein